MSDESRARAAADPQAEDAPTATADGIALLQEERDRFREQLLRTQAEFVNYQKRSKTQADLDRQYAVGNIAKDLLDVLDNCERGAEAARSTGAASIAEGFDMVHRQLLAVLGKHSVEPIAALGETFDPNLHEAIVQQPPSPSFPEGTVSAVLSRGYKIRDRVLRPAKVAVAGTPHA